ncbi:MAG: hypothetical protein WAM14_14915 [Candidatus Nitrosopolaris sp.]
MITASWEIIQHNNKWIDAKKEFQTRTISSAFMALRMKSLNAVKSKDMDQIKQIFVFILSLLILPTNAYAHTVEYEHGYKAALNDTLGPTGDTSLLRFKACGAVYNTTQQMANCHQGYQDGSNAIEQSFKQTPEYKGYASYQRDVCNQYIYNFTQLIRCIQGNRDGYNTMTNQSFAHKLEYDFGYAVGKVDALDTNIGAKKDPSICEEPTYFVRQQTAICEIGYAQAYNHFCLILPYNTSEECQVGGNGKIVAEANQDIRKELMQMKP